MSIDIDMASVHVTRAYYTITFIDAQVLSLTVHVTCRNENFFFLWNLKENLFSYGWENGRQKLLSMKNDLNEKKNR